MTNPLRLGDVKIDSVVEYEAPLFDVFDFFPALKREMLDEHRAWLEPKYIDPATGKVVLCVQSYIVRTPHHNILIDTCVGNHKPRPARPFWHMMSSDRYERGLAAAGLSVHDIDYVMCTHLHVDHVGWNTRLENGRWMPTFPKARYLFADRELQHWTEKSEQDPASFPWIVDSVLPVIAAGRAEAVRSDHVLNDLVRLVPTPGHTIDHFSVHVGKPGADALITGDFIHSPLQARIPDLGMRADYDSAQAGRTRRAIFERFAEEPTLMCTAHFPSPSTGRFVQKGDAFSFVPA
jgi:glyoxylase-like metal-dependent hydrolase (beta-lactamase superfamily II)